MDDSSVAHDNADSVQEWLDGRIDIDMNPLGIKAFRDCEALRDGNFVQIGERFGIETPKVAIHGIQARHHAAGEAYEQRIGGERFETENALFTGDARIDEQTHLRPHAIGDAGAAFEPIESTQSVVDTELAHKVCASDRSDVHISRVDSHCRDDLR